MVTCTASSHHEAVSTALSSPSNHPLDVLDAHFLSCFLIIVEPLSLGQIDSREFGSRFNALSLPFTLWSGQSPPCDTTNTVHTSGLKSVNSSPRQSMSIKFFAFAGEFCSYVAGAALMVALDSR